MQKITIFGKGGIGKSTVSANLAALYARQGLRVLLVGCDPKHDTTVALTDGRPIQTVVERSAFMDSDGGQTGDLLVRGRLGVDCIEAGGPEPGIGCAGRGISRMIELMESAGILREDRYDVALFDVLGDVVCGGFAAPLRQGFADKVVIVTSEELMSLYAANNIARAIRNYAANGAALCGLAANLRDPGADRGAVERFAALIGTRVLTVLERDPAVREAEYLRRTLVEHAPLSAAARALSSLAEDLLAFDRSAARTPEPLSDETFHELSREAFVGRPSKAVPPAAAPTPKPAAAALPTPPAVHAQGPDLEKSLERHASLWEDAPGPNSQVWGASDQWRRFFCDFETRRHARTRLEVRDSTIHVWHQDLECSYATPDYFDASLPSFFKFPWPSQDPSGGRPEPDGSRKGKMDRDPAGLEAMTNLRDLDVIHGGGRKLDLALEAAVERAARGVSAIVVHSTCVPTVIGDDSQAVVSRWRERSPVPVVYSNPAETNVEVDVGLLTFKKMREDPSFSAVAKKERSINLVGYPEDSALGELLTLLRSAGITVNARVMPFLDIESARRYLAAPVQVLYPNAAYEPAYRDAFETLPLRTLRLDAPYGWASTQRWLTEVAAACSLPKGRADKTLRAAAKPLAEAWRAGRERAALNSVAFILDSQHITRLTDPAQTWGVPMLRALREMGFGVEVFCHGESERAQPGLSFFDTPARLDELLRASSCAAVYSEYAADVRLACRGKVPFSLDCFELGLAGAVRTLERLNALCAWPFNRRYGRYLNGG